MAANDLFMDSSGFYAALDVRDICHKAAVWEITKTVKSGAKLIFTDYIITESLNLAVARRGHHVAGRMLDFLEQSSAWKRISVDSSFFEGAVDYFRKHADKDFSFTDCTSFVVMKTLRLTRALSDDHHFRQAGFQPLLKI
jgi:predicted nucleic acid-binding protein